LGTGSEVKFASKHFFRGFGAAGRCFVFNVFYRGRKAIMTRGARRRFLIFRANARRKAAFLKSLIRGLSTDDTTQRFLDGEFLKLGAAR